VPPKLEASRLHWPKFILNYISGRYPAFYRPTTP